MIVFWLEWVLSPFPFEDITRNSCFLFLPILKKNLMLGHPSVRNPTVLKMAITCCKQTRTRWNCSLRISFSYEYHFLLPSVSNTDDDGDYARAHLYFNGCLSLAVYAIRGFPRGLWRTGWLAALPNIQTMPRLD